MQNKDTMGGLKMMHNATGTSEQIHAQILSLLQETVSIQQRLEKLKHPKPTLIGQVVGSAAKDIIPGVLGDTAGEIVKSFGFPGTLVRKYTRTGTRNYLRESQKQQFDAMESQISSAVDNIIERAIGLLSQISSVKPSLRAEGNSNELCRKFVRVKSLQRPSSKISRVISSLSEISTLHLVYNKDIPAYLIESQSLRSANAYELLRNLESSLRTSIEKSLAKISIGWWTERVPNDVRENAEDRKQADERPWPWHSGIALHPLHYVDFRDYEKIIVRKDNWNDVFEKVFGNKEYVISKFTELDPIRKAIAHSRKISQKEFDKLKLYSNEIIAALSRLR